MTPQHARNWGDVIGSVLLMLTGIGVVAGSIQLTVGTPTNPHPGFFPFLGGIILVGLSLPLLVRGWRGAGPRSAAFGELRRPVILVVAMGVYVAILDPLGYILATLFIAAVILRVLGVTSWWRIVIAGVLLSVVTYVLFDRALGIELPGGLLDFLG